MMIKTQPELPRLPVPDLDKTLQRYLEAIEPILNAEQTETLKELVRNFAEAEGPILQQHLYERQFKFKNWAYDWWLNDMYMNNPLCLPINSNPGGVWPPQKFNNVDEQLYFAAKLTTFILRFKEKLEKNELEVEKATAREPGQPLCMAQHYRILSTYRVPCIPRDYQRDTSALLADHIIVAYKKHFFTCPIRSVEGFFTTEEIFNQLKFIVQSESSNNEFPLGILTSQRRPLWADQRIKLLGDELNKQALEEIETCYFLICLDDPLPGQYFNSKLQELASTSHGLKERDETSMLHQMIHGGGSIFNSGNRWFDKTLQFIISSDGVVGICYEHSPAEGIGILGLIDDFYCKLKDGETFPPREEKEKGTAEAEALKLPSPMKLEWHLSMEDKLAIKEASLAIDNVIQDFDLNVYRYENYGKDFIKKAKCSPDVYIQLALQLAYFLVHKKMVATYESGSTRRYKLGRVDCIRSTTMEALEWVKAASSGADHGEIMEKFHKAIDKQTAVMIENITGEGIDVHLLGLKQQASEIGMDVPKLFNHETFQMANNFELSTSQLPTKVNQFMGYGAVVPNGYGVSYNPQPHHIVFCISSFHSSPSTSSIVFARNLKQSLEIMKNILEQ